MNKKNQDLINGTYKLKKQTQNKVVEFAEKHVSSKTLANIQQCGTFLKFIATFDKEKKKLIHADFCKNRFCPVCAWRKARKDSSMLSVLLKAISVEKNYEFLFLTLTTPNVVADELKAEIDRFNNALKKLFKRKKVVAAVKGYVRKLEITYNSKRDDYNPHFHVLLAVEKSYFNNSKKYIPHSEWLELWRDVTGLPEITQVNVKKVKGSNKEKAVKEVSKYSTKDFELIESQEVFDVFYKAMKGRQLITFNGVFKEYKKKFDNKELEKYKEKDKNEYYWYLTATWSKSEMKYGIEYRALTENEKKFFNEEFEKEF